MLLVIAWGLLSYRRTTQYVILVKTFAQSFKFIYICARAACYTICCPKMASLFVRSKIFNWDRSGKYKRTNDSSYSNSWTTPLFNKITWLWLWNCLQTRKSSVAVDTLSRKDYVDASELLILSISTFIFLDQVLLENSSSF